MGCCAVISLTERGLIDTVSNKHIATFLGMMPVTISRLRRELQENGLDADRASDLPSDAPMCGGIIGEKGVISLILTCALLVGMCWCGRSRHTSARSRRSGMARLRKAMLAAAAQKALLT